MSPLRVAPTEAQASRRAGEAIGAGAGALRTARLAR